MAKAIWKGQTIAESDDFERVEGNIYFPPDALDRRYVEESDETSHCPWKGEAKYYDIVVDDERNPGAAWYYPAPKPKASHIEGHVAFWRGVEVEE